MNRIATYYRSLDRGSPPWWSWVIGLTGLFVGIGIGGFFPRHENVIVNVQPKTLAQWYLLRAEQRHAEGRETDESR